MAAMIKLLWLCSSLLLAQHALGADDSELRSGDSELEANDPDLDNDRDDFDPQLLAGFQQRGGLRRWLYGLSIPISKRHTVNMTGMGSLEVIGGECRSLEVDKLSSKDSSSGLLLDFDLELRGVGIQCHLDGLLNGTLSLDIIIKDSALNTSVLIHPFTSEVDTSLPMPFGHLNVTRCSADLLIHDIKVSGNSSVLELIDSFSKDELIELMDGYVAEPMCDSLKKLVETKGSDAFLQAANLSAPLLLPVKAPPAPELLQPAVDWGTFPPALVLKSLVAERFSVWADRVVQILNVHSFSANLVHAQNVSLDLKQLRIGGMGSARRQGVTVISENDTLGFLADFPGLTADAVFVLTVYLPGQPMLTEVVAVKVGLNRASLQMRALAREGSIDEIDLQKVIQSPRCIVDCTEGVTSPQSDALAVKELNLELRPVLELEAYGAIESDVTHLANQLLSALLNGYLPTANALANGGLGLARTQLDAFLWKKIHALSPCSASKNELGLDEDAIDVLPYVALCILLLGVFAAVCARCRIQDACTTGCSCDAPGAGESTDARDAQMCERPDQQESSDAADDVDAAQGNDGITTEDPDRAGVSLACEPAVPLALATIYPFAVVAVMFLFFYADFAEGATVSLLTEANGQINTIGPVFTFSLLSTVIDSLTSGSWVIGVLTLVMSGLWPHIKLFLLLVIWVVPPQRFSKRARNRVLRFLDTWGKYGFLESWFLVFSMSAFAIEWSSINASTSLKVLTTPSMGFYAFFAATVLMVILGHVASECNALVIGDAENATVTTRNPNTMSRNQQEQQLPQESTSNPAVMPEMSNTMSDSAQTDPSTRCSEGSTAVGSRCSLSSCTSKFTRGIVAFGLMASVVLAVVGSSATSFEFSISGMFMEFLFDRPVEKEYSLLSIGNSVAAGRFGDVGLVILEAMFFILCLAIPLALLCSLLVLWLVPLTKLSQQGLLHTCRILDAWACLDVAALVLVISIVQFGAMAEFLIAKGSLAAPCAMVANLEQEDCLNIDMNPRAGVVPLVLAGLAMLFVPKGTIGLCEVALGARLSSSSAKVQGGEPDKLLFVGRENDQTAGQPEKSSVGVA